MSRKIIHLTYWNGGELAINADHIISIRRIGDKTRLHSGEGEFDVSESYPTVLRMWADALASED